MPSLMVLLNFSKECGGVQDRRNDGVLGLFCAHCLG